MPWPFDKYKRPAAAKYWLSKFPKTSGDQDEYPEEYVYLDQLEERIEGFHEKFKSGENYERIYNEFGWENHEQVTKAYGVGTGADGAADGHGRGKKINPAWYVGPWFHTVGRITTPAVQHMPAAQVRHDSTLGAIMQLPPEEPSVFKFWNAYQLWGMTGMIMLSKEIFVIGHDFWHALLFWFGFSVVTSVCVDWWLWWYALRGQEFYDLKFYPLNNKVECIYNLLHEMETKGAEKNLVLSAQVYGDQLANRLAKHKMLAAKVNLAYELQEKLNMQAAKEGAQVKEAEGAWKTDAMSGTEEYFNDEKIQKDYMKTALANFQKGDAAVLRAAADAQSSSSTVFADKYTTTYNDIKDKYLGDNRKAGSLPWGFASDAEKKKAKKPDKDKQAAIAAQEKALKTRYHAFA